MGGSARSKSDRAHRWRLLLNLGQRTYGYLTLDDLLHLGFTRNELAHLVQVGQLEASNRGLYRVPSFSTDWRSKLHRQASGTSAVVSHLSAAMVIGLARPSDITPGYGELTVGRQMRKRLDEVRLYRDPNFAELATDCRDGLQVTRIDRTLLDIGANHDLSLFRMCFNGAIRQRLITHAAFVEAAGNDKRRRGRRQLEQAVAAVDGEVVTPSDWSQLATERLVAAGLPRPQLETLLCDRAGRTIGRVDMYWPEFAVVVELDGRAFHLNPRSFESDRQRDARLAGVGITVLRFTWSQYQDGDYFERTIADVLQHRD